MKRLLLIQWIKALMVSFIFFHAIVVCGFVIVAWYWGCHSSQVSWNRYYLTDRHKELAAGLRPEFPYDGKEFPVATWQQSCFHQLKQLSLSEEIYILFNHFFFIHILNRKEDCKTLMNYSFSNHTKISPSKSYLRYI